MEKNKDDDYGEEEDSEYVLLDLEAVRGQIDIPPNAPYTLSLCIDEYGFDFVIFLPGNIAYLIYWYFAVSFEQDCYECQDLDTMNPILIIDKKVKLVTVGCGSVCDMDLPKFSMFFSIFGGPFLHTSV
ncbi:hypothetical protein GOBAR_AA22692 [Gossypium barbadense]|uniref:Uncharacterized protein n=1 Tax=Gossypium barbadense TaxID=3634 RepID=A0A2P5X3R5_GOSBA|nr:hypothetical protein GOBAR_AA22692 [Gossypium barbadense]